MSRDELHPLVMATLTEIQAAFARLAKRQKRATIKVKPHAPPETAREVLALLFPDHGNHSVSNYETRNLAVLVTCSCGHAWTVDVDMAMASGCKLNHVREALKTAPRVS